MIRSKSPLAVMLTLVVASALGISSARAQCPSATAGPDITVSAIPGALSWGTQNGITAYTFATDACNLGDEDIPFIQSSSTHPVITTNLYRFEHGRFEQIGLGWVKHTFGSANDDLCCICDNPGTIALMGPGCSDLYFAQTNGNQGRLGPRSDINAYTGEFDYPYTSQNQTGGILYKRMQVRESDVDPALHPDARYFGEAQYVDPTDSEAGNSMNNIGYREIIVGDHVSTGWTLIMTGPTRRGLPAVSAWNRVDADVEVTPIDVPGDGRMYIASDAKAREDGTWRYEYVLYNMNSHRCASSLSLPISDLVEMGDMQFSDVEYHSGEPYDATDWAMSRPGGDIVTWQGESFVADVNGNALRWGTAYNFGFTASTPPHYADAVVGLFRPGAESTVTASVRVPKRPCQVEISCFDSCQVEWSDYLWFTLCLFGPGTPADEVCTCNDVNDDGLADLQDFAHLQNEFTGDQIP